VLVAFEPCCVERHRCAAQSREVVQLFEELGTQLILACHIVQKTPRLGVEGGGGGWVGALVGGGCGAGAGGGPGALWEVECDGIGGDGAGVLCVEE